MWISGREHEPCDRSLLARQNRCSAHRYGLEAQGRPERALRNHALCHRQCRPLPALEAKRASTNPVEARAEVCHYAKPLEIPFAFVANGKEVWFLYRETDAYARKRMPARSRASIRSTTWNEGSRRARSAVAIDPKIVDRDYHLECIEALSAEILLGRRKLLVEMATGTGKTWAGALVKCLFQAAVVARVLLPVDRIALNGQAEDAFIDHPSHYSCNVLRPGRRFDRTKRITISTLQTVTAEYRELSRGYFDLVIHRSKQVKRSGLLRYFDGMELGLTATP